MARQNPLSSSHLLYFNLNNIKHNSVEGARSQDVRNRIISVAKKTELRKYMKHTLSVDVYMYLSSNELFSTVR